jgi:[acyl-carrier-protein] S-malonyltransferase
MSWGAVFPGQGSQQPGMGHFLFENFKEVRLRFEEASDAISVDFKKLCFTGDEAELQLTKNTQPALLLVSTASYDVIKNITDFAPIASAGHSIGEYAALVSQGVLSFRDGIQAVRARGEAMQDAVPVGEGGMCAVIGMNDNQVRELCKWVEKESGFKPLEPANFNSPGQVVISGNAKAIEWMQANFKKEVLSEPPARAKFIQLKVSAPFHCSLMKPAEEKMRLLLTATDFKTAKSAIVQNVNAEAFKQAVDLRENIIRQITAPVLWVGCVEKLKALGCTQFVEFGSGKVLAGLIKKIAGDEIRVLNMNSLEDVKAIEAEI